MQTIPLIGMLLPTVRLILFNSSTHWKKHGGFFVGFAKHEYLTNHFTNPLKAGLFINLVFGQDQVLKMQIMQLMKWAFYSNRSG